jgi:PAS domain S-box-containing protein
MPKSAEDLVALVVRHLAEVAVGECSITEQEILACERENNHGLAEILTGLLYLHEDLAFQREKLARKNSELSAKEAFARSITESAGDAIVTADIEGRLVGWNKGAQDIFGYSAAEVMGKPLTVLMPERYREAHARGLAHLAQTGESRILGKTLELEGLRKDGSEFSMELRVDSWGAEGRTFFTGIIRDITARKRREAEIQKLNEELEAFSYSVSHDLRAPLRAMNAYSRILVEECANKLDDEHQRHLRIIMENARRMGQLIDDLLEFSRMGRTTMQHVTVDMHEVAVAVLDQLTALYPQRKILVSVGVLPAAWADRALIRQVFVNLLDNAVKYTRPRHVASIEVGGSAADSENTYWIRDNGVGFQMEYVHKLFGVFQRLHGREEFEGTGVGLALVQRIIHRHGGRVWAVGAVDQGATFTFTLPKKGDYRAGI